jgi:hypothetical protein
MFHQAQNIYTHQHRRRRHDPTVNRHHRQQLNTRRNQAT